MADSGTSVRGRRIAVVGGGVAGRVPASVVEVVVSLAIRLHGIYLYLRGLPVFPRPRHRIQEGLE